MKSEKIKVEGFFLDLRRFLFYFLKKGIFRPFKKRTLKNDAKFVNDVIQKYPKKNTFNWAKIDAKR